MKKCYKCKLFKELNNFNKDKSQKDGLQNKCKNCKKQYALLYKEKNKERYIKNRQNKLNYQLSYYYNNKHKRIEYQIDYINKRRESDSLFKLITNYRSRTSMAFKAKKFIKLKTKNLLGTDLKTAKIFIENKFDKNMNWSNYGKWHIDHIIPLSTAKTKEELIKLCHYTNLQPLWAKDNLKKGTNIVL